MEIYERIKLRRKELGLTADDVADALGVSRATIYRYEGKDIKKLPTDIISPLASVLKCSEGYLMGWTDSYADSSRGNSNTYRVELKKFPVLGKIACGKPIYANEECECYVKAGSDINADFCLIASGDSMTGARILDGDIVFIKEQDIVNNGDIAAVVTSSESEVTLKRFYYYRDKALLILKPENPSYEDQIYQGEELDHIRVLGKAVAFQSNLL